ncbi:APC family permease [Emcibacteraceae bacterium]|nr:APC family permease [Emcibacteraceae bacterium]MDA9179948.1 APC family permease [Emcibacteraceae bacterium]MDA9552993.1 APC family permease [Emcibacteraceae bacterium]
MSDDKNDLKTIGLWGLIFTITGFVVGVSIFILPAELIVMSGPSVLLAYAIAGGMAIITCFATAQIGTLMPAEGGTFVAITRLLSPFLGFMAVWILLWSVVLVNSFIGYGFANYIVYFIPSLDKTVAAASIILLFGLINIVGSSLVVKVQGAMVIFFLIMLSIFIISGLPRFEVENLTPFMPNGIGSVFMAASIGYFSFAGFISLLEFGGEIKNPSKNIPLGLAISFVLVLGSYGGVSLILSGINTDIPFAEMQTPVLEVAESFLPNWVITSLVISIIAAAATTVNGLILGYSRDILVIAEARIFPSFLSTKTKRFNTPANAIITYTLLSVLVVLLGSGVEEYALVAVIGLLLQQLFIAVSLYRIPKIMKDEYDSAEFKLPKPVIKIVSVLLFLISAAFIIMHIFNNPIIGGLILGVFTIGSLIYLIAKRGQQND